MANSNIHSPLFKSDSNNCLRREYPADLLKFNAYIKPANSFEEACEIIKKKKLVLGEPAVVPFKYTNSDGTTSIELVFGIGSVESDRPFIKCSITNDILNDAVISGVDENGNPTYIKLIDILEDFISKEEADKLITEKVEETFKSGEVIDNVINEVLSSDKLNDNINKKLDYRFTWKPLSSKLEELGIM